MAPWADGIHEEEATSCDITGNEWLYVLSLEILAPMRDAVMYEPSSITTNETEWTKLTKVFVDC
jgi:hypothetical protein